MNIAVFWNYYYYFFFFWKFTHDELWKNGNFSVRNHYTEEMVEYYPDAVEMAKGGKEILFYVEKFYMR